MENTVLRYERKVIFLDYSIVIGEGSLHCLKFSTISRTVPNIAENFSTYLRTVPSVLYTDKETLVIELFQLTIKFMKNYIKKKIKLKI